VIRSHRLSSVAALFLLLACDGGKDTKAADAKPADAKPKTADAKTPDAKAPDAKAPDAAPDAAPTEKHFDVTKDKSGALARAATVLETSKVHDDENLRALSHHAEALPSFEAVCKHEVEVGKSTVAVPDCIKAMEHHAVQLGPEVYAQLATCIMDSQSPAEIDACDAATVEAEQLLHTKPHGEGLDAALCAQLFAQFEKLAMADAGDHAAMVEEVLEEVKADVITACQDQGTKAEVDCALAAKTMTELNACASKLL
jgi:hypothetical protein